MEKFKTFQKYLHYRINITMNLRIVFKQRFKYLKNKKFNLIKVILKLTYGGHFCQKAGKNPDKKIIFRRNDFKKKEKTLGLVKILNIRLSSLSRDCRFKSHHW